jgi:hypothetical protein
MGRKLAWQAAATKLAMFQRDEVTQGITVQVPEDARYAAPVETDTRAMAVAIALSNPIDPEAIARPPWANSVL